MSATPLGAIAEDYLAAARKAGEFFDGAALREAVLGVMELLPDGPLLLLSTSEVGVGIAAACAYAREGETSWRREDLTSAHVPEEDRPSVFVEAIEPDESWRSAVLRRYPEALIVSAATSRRSAAIAS